MKYEFRLEINIAKKKNRFLFYAASRKGNDLPSTWCEVCYCFALLHSSIGPNMTCDVANSSTLLVEVHVVSGYTVIMGVRIGYTRLSILIQLILGYK